ncbi:MAG: hypothetical protein WDZ51_07375 [Pirellulaceae bacterium]
MTTPLKTTPVEATHVIDVMDRYLGGARIYIHRQTGRLVCVAVDDPEEGFVLPGQHEERLRFEPLSVLTTEEIVRDDFVELPEDLKAKKWEGMCQFAAEESDPVQRRRLLDVIHGPHPFHNFRDATQELGLRKKWTEFRDPWLIEDVTNFLTEHDIAYTLDVGN